MRNIKGIAVGLCLAAAIVGFSTSSKATLIGTDVDVFLSVGGTTVINQTLSVTAPSSSVSANFGGVDYSVIVPDGLPGSDGSSFTLIPFNFSFGGDFRSDVLLTLSSLNAAASFRDYRRPAALQEARRRSPHLRHRILSSIQVGLPTYHFDIETTAVPEPVGITFFSIGLSVLLSRDANEPPTLINGKYLTSARYGRSFGAAVFFCRTSVKGQQRLF